MDTRRIIELLLAGEVDSALELCSHYLARVQGLTATDVMYFEPRMQIDSGHFGRLASAYSTVLSEVGLAMTVLHRHSQADSERNNWVGVFPIPDHVVGIGKIATQDQMAAFTTYFERIFGECLSVSQARYAIFATSRFLTMPGAVRAVEQARGLRGAILGVMETFPVPDCGERRLVQNTFRSAAEQVEQSTKSYLIFAESIPIREFLIECGFSSGRVFVNPYPAAHRFPRPPARLTGQRRPHLGSLAGTREVQNPALVAAYLMGSNIQGLDWMVRLNPELVARQLRMNVTELRHALLGKGVELLEARMSDTDYDFVIQSLDIMLLPYGERYRTIGSGIFLESLCAGVIPLVPERSTMRRLYLDLGGHAPAIDSLSVDGVHNAVRVAVQHLEELLENSLDVRRAWLANDQGPAAWARHVRNFVC